MEEPKKIFTRIQFRRITEKPTQLKPGELAFSEKENTLFIGTTNTGMSSSSV